MRSTSGVPYLLGIVSAVLASTGLYILIYFGFTGKDLIDAQYFTGDYFFIYAIYIVGIALLLSGFTMLGLASQKYKWKVSITFLVSFIVVFMLSPAPIGHPISFKAREAETIQNVHVLFDSLSEIIGNSVNVPVKFSKVELKDEYPLFSRNAFQRRIDEDDYFGSRNRSVFGDDWDEFIDTQKVLYSIQFNDMMNLATGYETGRDYFAWWNCYPASKHLDKRSIAIRSVTAGNFVYIPLGPDGDMLPYDADVESVCSANIGAFGFPTTDGLDVWTPTGDPNKPVTLKPDGIKDGVIMLLTLGPAE